jgi:hypothetical protein
MGCIFEMEHIPVFARHLHLDYRGPVKGADPCVELSRQRIRQHNENNTQEGYMHSAGCGQYFNGIYVSFKRAQKNFIAVFQYKYMLNKIRT